MLIISLQYIFKSVRRVKTLTRREIEI